MKGIILAGGSGTRLYPLTKSICKQLLPVYDKPLIYYPLSLLMLAGIREILIISTPESLPLLKLLLGTGEQWGLNFLYKIQPKPNGIAEAFIIGEEFIGDDNVALVLGDNLLYGKGLAKILQNAANLESGARLFAYPVKNPQSYGVISLNDKGEPIEIIEKPIEFFSPYAIPGIYFYDNEVIKYAKELKPSARGEMEITDINNVYLHTNTLKVDVLGRGFAWLDAGSFETMLQASNYVAAIQDRQGLMISSPEEIAYRMKFINKNMFKKCIKEVGNNDYRNYLSTLILE